MGIVDALEGRSQPAEQPKGLLGAIMRALGPVNIRDFEEQADPAHPMHNRRHGGEKFTGIVDNFSIPNPISVLRDTYAGTSKAGEELVKDTVRTTVNGLKTFDAVRRGELDPTSDEAIRASFDLAGMAMTGGLGGAPKGALGSGPFRGFPMDEASVAARMKEMNYSEQPFWRGDTGKLKQQADPNALPSEYPSGASFTRDPNYNSGGFGENREFRMNLQNTIDAAAPLTQGQIDRLVAAAKKIDPKFGKQMDADPGEEHWLLGLPGAHVIAILDRSGIGESVLKGAGFDGILLGHELKKLTGDGIRHKDAAFDPAKADRTNIFLGLGGAAALLPAMHPTED